MQKKFLPALLGALFIVVIAAVIIFTQTGAAQKPPAQSSGSADPQKLLIPRWFLRSLTLDGKMVEIPADQQSMTLQFKADGTANGAGGCNEFGTRYQAGQDGKMHFGEITVTLMACPEGMEREGAYLKALAKVERFTTEGTKLTLSSADGKTSLGFSMPPK